MEAIHATELAMEFGDSVQPVLPAAYRLAYGMLHSSPDAEDAVQESLLKAWRARGRLRPGSDVRPWFLTIVANQCRTQRRNRWWSVLKRPELTGSSGQDPGDAGHDADLRRALACLSHDQRLVVMLRFYLDLPFEEVGLAMGISSKAAKSRLHRALERLRTQIPEVLDDGR